MFRRRRSTDDFAEEIKSHLELEADELQSEGLSEDEARRRARVEFGNVQSAQERFYLRSRIVWFDNLLRDIKFAIRQLAKNPGFTSVAILVLALGIGTSVAIFAFVDAALLEPLPYANPGRIMSVNESDTELPGWPLSYPDFLDWQAQNKSFSSLDIYTGSGYLLRTSSGAEPVKGERVSGSFFQTLGVHPIMGRDFNPGEDRPGGPNVVILSYEAWIHRFGARPEVVGRDRGPGQSCLHDHRRAASVVFIRIERQRGVLGSHQFAKPSRAFTDFLCLFWNRKAARWNHGTVGAGRDEGDF